MKHNKDLLEKIILRAHYLANQMIFMANHRKDKEKGDPKVGGHASASSSSIQILGALHLVVKSGFDHIAVKPHASPADHSYNYLLDNLLKPDLSRLSLEEANIAMSNLRAFPQEGDFGFQSYHSTYDPDHHNFFPSGTVGIPPVNAGYLALAYRYAKRQGYDVPKAHFWSIIGDSEFREGSLLEAVPDFAEREISNLTWIVDYNRQSLDGHRITNPEIMGGNDDLRIERTMMANGWEVIQVRHGRLRQKLFTQTGGPEFQNWLEKELADYELQSLLLVNDPKELKSQVSQQFKSLSKFLNAVNDEDFYQGLRDFGGNDILVMIKALEASKKDLSKPCCIIAHTLKGWGLQMAATSGNHSALPDLSEILELKKNTGINEDTELARFADGTEEEKFLTQRGQQIYSQIQAQHELKEKNKQYFLTEIEKSGHIPETLDINLKMASYPHTQWMLGQLTSKLTRIANTPLDENQLKEKQKPLSEFEKSWKIPSELMISMAPDVGTSTNLNPSMDGKIYGANETEDFESEYKVKDAKTPDLVPGEEQNDRFLRFEIAEANVMSCVGSFGRLRDVLGIPIIPLMTVYDFFVKRALDQFFYNLYWKSSFILVGTPAGVTLSPEGAQHGWKSDIQIPNQITWEPFYCVELDWVLTDAMRRHILFDNDRRTGVFIRGVTRGVEQKDFISLLRTHKRFKEYLNGHSLSHKNFPLEGATSEANLNPLSDENILTQTKQDLLNGGYYLIDYRGYANYEPGDNVVHIFAMGATGTEAIKASNKLLEKGIYANVIMVSCVDLLVGNLAHENNYEHLRHNLQINSDLYLQPQLNGHLTGAELASVSGRRIPIVSVHDGEPGLLDNIGSIIGVRHESLAVRKHSKCGRPSEIYRFHKIDDTAIVEACGQVLSETALEQVKVSPRTLNEMQNAPRLQGGWQQLWPQK